MDEINLEKIKEVFLPIQCRVERDALLKEHIDGLNGPRWASMSAEKQQQWIQYRQELLDIPQQAEFPINIIWPTLPE